MSAENSAVLFAGIAASNASLFRRLRVPLGDPAGWISFGQQTVALVRDLEMDRVRTRSDADVVHCPADFPPTAGLSPDRETATAQAIAELLRRQSIDVVQSDRSLPLIYAWHLERAGIDVRYDPDLGVVDRRQKSEQEIDWMAEAQSVTESVMEFICQQIAGAEVSSDGKLRLGGEPLTSERVRALAAAEFLRRDYSMSHGAIAASVPYVADCHHSGTGDLKSGLPIVVDLFPMNNQTRYWGDCTRTVVHGQPSDTVVRMHRAVVEAKEACTKQLRAGNTADAVHQAGEDVLLAAGFENARGRLTDEPSIQHGTGHGIGLEVHEPILLDFDGGELLEREVFTIEPGLYGKTDGGVRIEDMLVVRDGDAQNLNRLHQGLDWS